MAAITDEAVLAYSAARDLAMLCDAYRAASRAHALVLGRIGEGMERSPRYDRAERLEAQRWIARRGGTARDTDAVFAIRAAQLERRMLELRGLAEPE